VAPSSPVHGSGQKAAFIDRDGVLNQERGFVHRIEDFHFIPGSIDALRQLQAAGYRLVIVTNQSGIARGLYTEQDYGRLTEYMIGELSAKGVQLAAVEYCPHLPDAPVEPYRVDCLCRKPRPGMFRRAITRFAIDPSRSLLVGDRASDVQAARSAGIGRCFLVLSGQPVADSDVALADGVYPDLAACVDDILSSGINLTVS
jgi:D-glycero-D-manno-heptose 1,7-bisphosphate phosphatase